MYIRENGAPSIRTYVDNTEISVSAFAALIAFNVKGKTTLKLRAPSGTNAAQPCVNAFTSDGTQLWGGQINAGVTKTLDISSYNVVYVLFGAIQFTTRRTFYIAVL